MICISSGHGLYVRGAVGPAPWGLDEVNEARRVVDRLKEIMGDQCVTFHDNTSTTQQTNLQTITRWHNSKSRKLDVSCHFNAYTPTSGGRGVEVCYVSQQALAAQISAAISNAGGLINRGAKYRSDLYVLNKTTAPAVLIECCFVDAAQDVSAYQTNFSAICSAIAKTITGTGEEALDQIKTRGKVSWFGGPSDTGVSPSEGLAFLYEVDDKPHLFLKHQPPGTTGLARRLDPSKMYLAMRWDYQQFPKEFLAGKVVGLVRNPKNGKEIEVHPADWGPADETGRVADVSPGVMEALGLNTDDEVEVVFPA